MALFYWIGGGKASALVWCVFGRSALAVGWLRPVDVGTDISFQPARHFNNAVARDTHLKNSEERY